MITAATKKAVCALLNGDVFFSTKRDFFVFKSGFFYQHGRTSETTAASVVAKLAAAYTVTIVDASEHYSSWPRDSWFEVHFTVTPKGGQ